MREFFCLVLVAWCSGGAAESDQPVQQQVFSGNSEGSGVAAARDWYTANRNSPSRSTRLDRFDEHASQDWDMVAPISPRRLTDEPLDISYSICFLLDMLIIGALALQLTECKYFTWLQYTVLLFVLGVIYAIIHDCHPEVAKFRGVYFVSYRMWMAIPPQVLMWVFLPPLIMYDAMSTDVPLAGRVYKQVIWLAGPFVLMNTALLAPILYLITNWEPALCVAGAAMWGCTDPVAVVALLNDLGAHPLLTAFIQGESLLNDGAAIITFTISLGLVRKTVTITPLGLILEVTLKILGSTALGLMIGFVAEKWIRHSSKQFAESTDLVQVSLTIVAAFLAWAVAEGVFSASGVICTVAMGFVLAKSMWLSIVHRNVMQVIWNVIAYAFNTTIFFLAGALTGHAFWNRHHQDFSCFWKLILIWLALVVVRGVCLLLSWPMLSWLSRDIWIITWKEIVVMTWGGLRGAVGLCLAIQLLDHRYDLPTEKEANNAIFYTGGLACLTMVINAQLSPLLLNLLGVTETSDLQYWTMENVRGHLSAAAANQDDGKTTSFTQAKLHHVLDRITDDTVKPQDIQRQLSHLVAHADDMSDEALVLGFAAALSFWDNSPRLRLPIADVATPQFRITAETQFTVFCGVPRKPERLAHVNSILVRLVRSEYWNLVSSGEFGKRHAEVRILFDSASFALAFADRGLFDLRYIFQTLHIVESREDSASDKEPIFTALPQLSTNNFYRKPFFPTHSLTHSLGFLIFVLTVTVVLTVYSIAFEKKIDDTKGSKVNTLWLVLHGLASLCFGVDLGVRIYEAHKEKRHFFEGFMPLEDVLFTLMFFMELVIEGVAVAVDGFDGERTKFRTLNRVLCAFRLFRVVTLVNTAYKTWKREEWEKRARIKNSLSCVTILTAFVKAHIAGTQHLLNFFGTDATPKEAEIAFCVAQSQTMVYRALAAIATEASMIDDGVLEAFLCIREAVHAISGLADEVESAFEKQILDKKESSLLLRHPELERANLDKMFGDLLEGRLDVHKFSLEMTSMELETASAGESFT